MTHQQISKSINRNNEYTDEQHSHNPKTQMFKTQANDLDHKKEEFNKVISNSFSVLPSIDNVENYKSGVRVSHNSNIKRVTTDGRKQSSDHFTTKIPDILQSSRISVQQIQADQESGDLPSLTPR